MMQGNHFNEWAGFEGDYTRYPRRSQAEHFLRHYLTEAEGRQPVSCPLWTDLGQALRKTG
jgi:hypothetical protein